VSKNDWETFLNTQIARANEETSLDVALSQFPRTLGCGCKFRLYLRICSTALEVVDTSLPGAQTMYAIRASIPLAPLTDEIKWVARGFTAASKTTDPTVLYASIPTIFPKLHLVPTSRSPPLAASSSLWPI
jgi:hypothetical protein